MSDTSENTWDAPMTDLYGDSSDALAGEQPTTRREIRVIGDLRDEVSELREQLARSQADLTNYRNRKRRDLDDQYEAGRGEVISNLVPVLDNVAGAKEHGDLSDDNPLTSVVKSLTHTLEGLGLGAIGVVGEAFDPRIHEALHVEYTPEAEGTTISKVHQRGYATSDKLLRPALVTVLKRS